MGAIVVAIIGVVGNRWAKSREDRQKARDFTQITSLELEKAHESRPWTEMGRRLDDLKQENKELEQENDRLREERDKLRLEAIDWQIEAKKASGALARVVELQQQCEQERLAHQQIVERLSSEIDRCGHTHWHDTSRMGATYRCTACCATWEVEESPGDPCWCGFDPEDREPASDVCPDVVP